MQFKARTLLLFTCSIKACVILDLGFHLDRIRVRRDAKDHHLELIYVFLPLFINEKADVEGAL